MRILRLYAPSLIGDHTLCYVHNNDAGETCINEVPITIRLTHCGEPLDDETARNSMNIVLPVDAAPNDGDFMSLEDDGGVLRWSEPEKRFTVASRGFLSVSGHVEFWRPIKAAILTVSDKGSKGEREDTAGPELAALSIDRGIDIMENKIVPDDKDDIAAAITEWCGKGYNLVLTTGGTGLSERDVTPEALLSIADKVVPGFGEMMRIETLCYTPRAFLTRGVAVIKGKTLVIAFPGSRRAARECFEAVAPGLRHGVETLAGWEGECGRG
ncbi:MAG: MogA/MoaB family molybdenum cofactor biosynthesis protein [Synergistaceae bacterium]|nr:MogA/MoaB family molybdenum cofactor biosynthesis protein [Synergistaceae bacterium]